MNPRTRSAFLLLCTITFCAVVAMAQAPSTIFQLDGNPAPDGTLCNYGSGAVQCDTWNGVNLTGTSGSGREHSAVNTFILGSDSTNSFTGGGSKDANPLSQWSYSSSPTPNKDTLNAGYAAAYNVSDFDVIFGADRLAPNGDANIGIWFFQQDVGLSNGKFINKATGSVAQHVDGDVFIISAFTGGGGSSTISAYKWDHTCTSAKKNPGVGDCAASNLRVLETASSVCNGADECAATNSNTVTASWAGYATNNQLASPLFFEGGLDVTKAFAGSTAPCFASFLEETRSSQSVSAVLKDFLLGDFPVCAVSVTKACGTATISNGTITFPVSGTVTNTGIGTLYNVQVVDTITGGSTNTINVASTLAAGASASWGDSSTSTTSTSQTDTAQAQAATSSGGVASVFSSSVSKTCTFTVNNSLTVSKSCSASLVASGGDVHVSVSYGGQVCNTGQTNVSNITLTDYPGTSTSGSNVVTNLSVNAGACVSYPTSGALSYTPTQIASTPTAGRDVFEDTITISSATPQFGTLTPVSGNPDRRVNGSYAYAVADCPICPAGFCAAP